MKPIFIAFVCAIATLFAAAPQGNADDGLEISRFTSGRGVTVIVAEDVSARQSVTLLDHGGNYLELTAEAPHRRTLGRPRYRSLMSTRQANRDRRSLMAISVTPRRL